MQLLRKTKSQLTHHGQQKNTSLLQFFNVSVFFNKLSLKNKSVLFDFKFGKMIKFFLIRALICEQILKIFLSIQIDNFDF